MRRGVLATLVTVAGVCGLAVAPSLAAKRAHARPVVLRGVLHRDLTLVTDVAANDRFVYVQREFIRRPVSNPLVIRTTGTLIDEATGKHSAVNPGACAPGAAAFGGPWLMLNCFASARPRTVLYDLVHKRLRNVSAASLACASPNVAITETCGPVAVGRRWIAVAITEIHGLVSILLQPVTGGQPFTPAVRPGGTTTFDLDGTSGVRPLCRPLTYPSFGNDLVGPQPGWLQMRGRFALAGPASSTPRYLERCGSRTQTSVGAGVDGVALAADAQIVVWPASGPTLDRLTGLWLPSMRRFSITLPGGFSALGGQQDVGIAVSRRTIYVRDYAHVLWKGTIPAPPSA